MEARLLGTAGWTPSDHRETACVYLREGDRVLLLDAGTGMRRLLTDPRLLDGVTRVDVCLSHFHLDHIVGLACLPGLAAVERVVWGPGRARYGTPTTELLSRLIGSPFFSVPLDRAASSVAELPIGGLDLGPFEVRVRAQDLHTDPSVAFRVGDELAYCTDTGYDLPNAELAAGCRHLLHEAFWWGAKADDTHCTAAEAATVARHAGVERLTLLHVDPRMTDEDALREQAAAVFADTVVGRDGDLIG